MIKNSFDANKYKTQLDPAAWGSFIKERTENIKILKNYNTFCRYSEKTFYLSSLYLDIISIRLKQRRIKINYDRNQIIIGSMLLASKFIENEFDPNFELTQKWYFTNFSLDSILKHEEICLKLLEFKLNYSSAFDFCKFFINHGIVLASERPAERLEEINQRVMDTLSNFLENEKFIDFDPLQIACSCISITRNYYQLINSDHTFYNIYKIKSENLKDCMNNIQGYF